MAFGEMESWQEDIETPKIMQLNLRMIFGLTMPVAYTIKVYNRNDSGLCYKIRIVIKLALATIENYDCRIILYYHEVCYIL